MYPIEILATNEGLYKTIEKAIELLNKVQKEFHYYIPPNTSKIRSYSFALEEYSSKDVFDWLENYRKSEGGNKPFIILVIDGNLNVNHFGSLDISNGFAVFTLSGINQFINDNIRYCRYYIVRYSISFAAPFIRGHATAPKGCMFDNKHNKWDILLSLNTGRLCDSCKKQYMGLNIIVQNALDDLLLIVSNQHPFAIVMKGGGIKGLAFAGALIELEKYFSFNIFAGTSAGAIAAILLGAGYRPSELLEILQNKDFSDFKDAGLLQFLYNLPVKKGLYPGDEVEAWLNKLLEKYIKKTGSEIQMSDLITRTIVYATRQPEGILVFDSNGDRKTQIASFAARCSMSIPYFFIPKTIDGIKVFDGGFGNNFPLKTFIDQNQNKPFIGLYLKSKYSKYSSVIKQLVNISTDSDERQIVERYKANIVEIDPSPIKTTQFNLSKKKKEFLVLTGRVAALQFLYSYYPDCKISEKMLDTLKTELAKKRNEI